MGSPNQQQGQPGTTKQGGQQQQSSFNNMDPNAGHVMDYSGEDYYSFGPDGTTNFTSGGQTTNMGDPYANGSIGNYGMPSYGPGSGGPSGQGHMQAGMSQYGQTQGWDGSGQNMGAQGQQMQGYGQAMQHANAGNMGKAKQSYEQGGGTWNNDMSKHMRGGGYQGGQPRPQQGGGLLSQGGGGSYAIGPDGQPVQGGYDQVLY